MQGTQVGSLVREDFPCCRAAKPVCHSYWAQALSPQATSTEPVGLEPVLLNKRSHSREKLTHRKQESLRQLQLEKARPMQRRPRVAKSKQIKITKKKNKNKTQNPDKKGSLKTN